MADVVSSGRVSSVHIQNLPLAVLHAACCVHCKSETLASSVLLLLAAVQAPGDEPAWRQLLRHLHHNDREVVHYAIEALAM
jgi:hypothetical protein